MQTSGKKPPTRSPAPDLATGETQLERFKRTAQEVEADESPDALNRAFSRLNTKQKVLSPKTKKKR
jgi:hypothetical protein